MDPDLAFRAASDTDVTWGEPGPPLGEEPSNQENLHHLDLDLDLDLDQDRDRDSEQSQVLWVPSERRLLSGLLGLNVVLLGAAMVAGQAFNRVGLRHQEPQVFMLVLMLCSLAWMLWYLLWARHQPGISPHKDHHAGGVTVTVVLMLFATFSLLLHVFRMGYFITMRECNPIVKILSPFIEAPFLGLQTYLLWAHSKDCVHKHKILTRSGLMVTLCADLLLWLNAVTEDTIHQEIELEKENFKNSTESTEHSHLEEQANTTLCQCRASPACLTFRRGYEILYPFNMEYYLMAGCMLYVMWKNVGRRVAAQEHHVAQKLTLRIVRRGGMLFGPFFGALVLVAGAAVFVMYQAWVGRQERRTAAFLVFYGYHLAVMPVMALCSLAGVLLHKLDGRAEEAGGHNPTRSLDVVLLLGAALGQLSLSYFCLVAALALGAAGPLGALGALDLSYSLLSLLELMLQNVFIIQGLHRHPRTSLSGRNGRQKSSIFQPKTKDTGALQQELKRNPTSAPSSGQERNGKTSWTKRATQEICAFLILSNVMLWVIPAFGAHPQFENGLGKQFFGFTAWFVLVNLGQPLGVFYRMHAVGALMELLISA